MSGTRIDGERLWQSHMRMAEIGATPGGGVFRLAASSEDGAARDLFSAWCREAGLVMRVDQIGNMFARRCGRRDDAAPVMIGSHLDSQPTGGRFDGAFGVLSGLEIVRTLDAAGIETDHPLEIVNWTNEEGCRFQPSSLGAEVYAGILSLEQALACQDLDGKRLGDELGTIGYRGESPVTGHRAKAYLEGHIEQGPILETLGRDIGVVEGSMGVNAFEVILTGMEAHTGATPINRRKDALLGAARIVSDVNDLARRHEPDGRATVAHLRITPNVRSVIAGRVVLTSDCRHKSPEALDRMTRELEAIFRRQAEAHGLSMEHRLYWTNPAQLFDKACVAAVADAVEELRYSHQAMFSGAGHDAIPVAKVVPAAMMFVPSRDGLSHNKAEYTSPEQLEAGCNVLLRAALRLATA